MRSRRIARSITALAIVAVVVSGCGGGDDDAKDNSNEDNSSQSDGSTDAGDEVDAPMPDLTGLTEDEARTKLLELGVDESNILTAPQESLLAAGTIVAHVPSAGSTITGSITLKVAGPVGPVPMFVGKQVSEVETWANDRGITFTEVPVPDADRADGEVVATTPEAGQEATSEIEVQVARTPSTKSLYLTEDLGDSYCGAEAGETFIDGDPYDGSFTQPDGDNCVFEFDLGRDWSRLTGIVGFTDTSDSGTRIRVQIKVDGTSKVNKVIDFGQKPLKLDVDVSDGLRLSIELSDVSGYGTIGFGNLQLIGAGDIDQSDEGADAEEGLE
ncbi:MAG: PASTA domain-containing protein [Propionibacteriales bacterium]|nr:PASTA domain-containing protein [Propionibacteriales bacterium]